ncbi:MAG: hypothetical protein LBG59_00035 [Candidatus Peribacteria bacterium]|jgi:hypothetical protein|nr:hypothetical protein [Candidatus Peribacteria bacterium]
MPIETSQTPPTPPAQPAQTPASSTPPTAPAQQAPQMNIPTDPVKYLEYLLDMMIKHESSDIYLTYGEEPTLRIF